MAPTCSPPLLLPISPSPPFPPSPVSPERLGGGVEQVDFKHERERERERERASKGGRGRRRGGEGVSGEVVEQVDFEHAVEVRVVVEEANALGPARGVAHLHLPHPVRMWVPATPPVRVSASGCGRSKGGGEG